MTTEAPLVAAILPPHEGFGPGRAGAIGMVARAQARSAGFRCVVFGGPQEAVFPDVAFRGVRPAFWAPGHVSLRFGAALLLPLWRLRPALIEVHNRPELALFLARCLPRHKVVLLLHNDPQSMRRARTATERAALLRRLHGVVPVSEWVRARLLGGLAGPPPIPVAVVTNAID